MFNSSYDQALSSDGAWGRQQSCSLTSRSSASLQQAADTGDEPRRAATSSLPAPTARTLQSLHGRRIPPRLLSVAPVGAGGRTRRLVTVRGINASSSLTPIQIFDLESCQVTREASHTEQLLPSYDLLSPQTSSTYRQQILVSKLGLCRAPTAEKKSQSSSLGYSFGCISSPTLRSTRRNANYALCCMAVLADALKGMGSGDETQNQIFWFVQEIHSLFQLSTYESQMTFNLMSSHQWTQRHPL